MCGILGWINHESDLRANIDVIKNQLKTLSRRGPDESGVFECKHALLAHGRLTVVDPEGGKQPMTKVIGNNKYTIVYNGELYNTEEVRKLLMVRGYAFNTYSDTEVLLVAFIEWKEECLKYINGIYAFAVWNETERLLFLARDPLGVKPLFYTIKNNSLLFSSEIKALLKHPYIEPVVAKEGLLEIFALGPARSLGGGVFKDIKEIPPAHFLLYSHSKTKLVEYWSLEAREHEDDLETTVSKTRELLVDAIERQLVADVPICTFLSGGLDSSAISAISAKYLKRHKRGCLDTYSLEYLENSKYFKKSLYQPDSDDYFVDIMTEFIGSNHQKIVLQNHDLATALIDAVKANDYPGMADIDSSMYLFCKEVRKKHTVALSGECADEIFGGYPWYTNQERFDLSTFPWAQSLDIRKTLIGGIIKDLPIEEYVQEKYLHSVRRVPKLPGETPETAKMRELYYLNIKWFMVTLLNRKDRMSMSNSLEVRVPFADYRIVEYAYNIPREMKLLDGREKGLLRKALVGILPEEIIYRKKSPYPKTHHPTYTDAVQSIMYKILNDKTSPILQLIDVDNVKEFVESKGKSIQKPWFGQLMTGPQVMAYLIQLNTWLKDYNVILDI
ncbi:asparagine synthase (glutamine-hydrolyzing) [Herbivorax sp. ANBcel31]|uniref:asparagine synthase (glutamine-hydrolyzing) n=1 Tax=Herbivorax sp. ANBcel31 TaxID=3069754 RepID=UPI0027B19130|nr:asparagine synthase (glutamine-hydrolyzing) [Herbivorax sp. ANBcel31]MDQ2086268.1 asparagine synthase (glutamine-hydrolyzing) [Herbivorax sp. ANBcel31]